MACTSALELTVRPGKYQHMASNMCENSVLGNDLAFRPGAAGRGELSTPRSDRERASVGRCSNRWVMHGTLEQHEDLSLV